MIKLFVSHSSRQKLFVREIEKRLPGSVDLWGDEKELTFEHDVESKLEQAIGSECDLFLLVVEHNANRSLWVRQEIAWALEREKRRDERILIPVVLDKIAWDELEGEELQKRKYLSVSNFDEATLAAFVRSLISELLAWSCTQRERKTEVARSSVLGTLEGAEDLLNRLAAEVRTLVHHRRRSDPLGLDALASQLAVTSGISRAELGDLSSLLKRLRQAHLLEGVFFDDEVIYLAVETFPGKRIIYRDVKARIGKAAARLIQPGYKIGMDGGSTTLELARRIGYEIRASALHDLEVYTNSLPAVSELLETLNDLDIGDRDTVCRITILGGWCRPMSMTVVPGAIPSISETDRYSILPEELDVAFVGTNGLYREEGFAVKYQFEGPTKHALLSRANRRVILADPSKFLIRQDEVFARFEDGLEIITAEVESFEDAIDGMRDLISTTPSHLVVAS